MRMLSVLVLGIALATPNFASATCWGRCHGCYGRCWGGCSGCYGGCYGGGCYGAGCYGGGGYGGGYAGYSGVYGGLFGNHNWWGAGYAVGNNYYSTCAGVYSGFYASGNGPYSYPFNYYLPSKGYYYYGPPSAAYIYPSGYAPPYTPGYTSIGFTGLVPGTAAYASASVRSATATTSGNRVSAYLDAESQSAPAPAGAVAAGSSDAVRVEVTLPDPDADLIIQGYEVKSKGRVRTFVSPPVDPGQAYSYVVTMRRAVDGRTVDETREIDVRSGSRVAVDFTRPVGEPVPAPAVRPASSYVP